MLDGETAFKLYDTYGFPLDLTQDALRQRTISVDLPVSRMRWSVRKPRRVQAGRGPARRRRRRSGSSFASASGRPNFSATTRKLRKAWSRRWSSRGAAVEEAGEGARVQIVVNQTPFYGESGGQVGDMGTIAGEGFTVIVSDTQKKGVGFSSTPDGGEGARSRSGLRRTQGRHTSADKDRANHSATHLLHEALREVLGTHVAQRVRWWRRNGCASISRIQRASRPRNWSASRRSPIRSSCRMRRFRRG